MQRDWLGIIARHPPVCVRGRVRARAFKTNVTVFPVLFLFWLKIEKPGEGERKWREGPGFKLCCMWS